MPHTPSWKENFVAKLTEWFLAAMRPLPWRETYDPYSVWISEIMLQQTQMERGVSYFTAWMRRFPDIASVAGADEDAILSAWEGLGYYSRARNLHAAAKRIMTEHGGEFPRDHAAIRALPGVGEYTAGAIASIAFNLPVPAVDANVLRIFARILDIDSPPTDKAVKDRLTALARSLMPLAPPRLINQGLMEFGALVCGKNPRCGECPLTDFCRAHRLGTVPDRPLKKEKPGVRILETVAGVLRRDGKIYIRKRPPNGLWAGLWEFPGGTLEPGEAPERAALRHIMTETGIAAAVDAAIGIVRHGYTTNRVVMHGFLCTAADEPSGAPQLEGVWAAPEDLGRFAFAAGHRKLLERLGWK